MFLFRLFVVLFVLGSNSLHAQELFPVTEPASTMPKKVWGLRLSTHLHYKYNTLGHREIARLMYGMSSRLTLMLTATQSNFHVDNFPEDLNIYYNNYHNHRSKQVRYPYVAESAHLYAKFRFAGSDRKNKHLRFALYSELAYAAVSHLDAFPSLMGDNSGVGLGVIGTKLHNKLAASVTAGVSKFFPYTRIEESDTIKFRAGNSMNVSLSIGYMVLPRIYKSYKDLNVNVYLEVLSKFYDTPTIVRNGHYLNTELFPYLRNGSLVNINPGVQFIIHSKTRVDMSLERPVFNNNNLNKYSMLIINVQRYFY